MAHIQQIAFINRIKVLYPSYFNHVRVLDLGSLDINGNNRIFFEDSVYIGLDIAPGKNVDVISTAHEYRDENLFDVIISTEMLEHDPHYRESLTNACTLLKPNGLFIFTCASKNRNIHGTFTIGVDDNPLGSRLYGDYYKNLEETDIREAIDIDRLFHVYYFEYESCHGDLYFYGFL